MKKLLGSSLLMLVASLVPVAVTSSAEAANPDSCRARILDFSKSNGVVKLQYEVWCSRTQDMIVVTPFLREGDRQATPTKFCYDTYYCRRTASLTDSTGLQWYYARPGISDGTDGNTLAKNYSGDVVACMDNEMPCATDGKQF